MRRRRLYRAEAASARAQQPQPNGLGRPGVQLMTLAMVALSIWLLTSCVGQVITGTQMDRRQAELQAEITALEAQKAGLEAQIAYVESPAYAGVVAREQLGLSREGDVVLMPQYAAAQPTPAAPPAALPPPPHQPNWQGWLRALVP